VTNDEFLSEFGHLAAAPGGVDQLREAILDLAVRGRLAAQDAGDEPVDQLLRRVDHEYSARVARGEAKRARAPGLTDRDSVPHAIPQTWTWEQLGALGPVTGGGTPRAGDLANFSEGGGIPWLTPADLSGRGTPVITGGRRFLTEQGLASSSASLMPAGTVLFSSRAPIGYVAIAGCQLCTNQGFKSVTPLGGMSSQYLYWVLRGAVPRIRDLASGTTFKEISGRVFSEVLVPIPPQEEQLRIVERIDELMGLCDELEERQAQAVARRAATARSALAELAELDRADTDRALRLVEEHVRLCLAPGEGAGEVLAQVRQAILDLAVQGRLVDHDPHDEPPRASLRHGSGPKGGSTCIPTHWVWSSLASVASYIQRGKSPAYAEKGRVAVLSQKCVRDGYVDLGPARCIQDESIGSYKPERFLQAGDILWNSTGDGTVGRSAVYESGLADHPVVADSHVTVVRLTDTSPEFVRLWLAATWVQTEVVLGARGSTKQTELNLSAVKETPVPLPPRGEQERIVARVGELLRLCDELEVALTSERDVARQLAASSCATIVAGSAGGAS
jgi:type I restriction enzyme S subunit